jgi:hypothetical protein
MGPGPLKVATVRVVLLPASALSSVVAVVGGVGNVPATLSPSPPLEVTTGAAEAVGIAIISAMSTATTRTAISCALGSSLCTLLLP